MADRNVEEKTYSSIEITNSRDNARISAAKELATSVDSSWRCNARSVAAALEAEKRGDSEAAAVSWGQTYPTETALKAFSEREDSLVVVIDDEDSGDTVGLGVFTEDTKRRGGGYWRWLSITPQPSVEAAHKLLLRIGDAGADRFGWVWGRVANETIADIMLEHPDCRRDPEDPQVLTYLRPE